MYSNIFPQNSHHIFPITFLLFQFGTIVYSILFIIMHHLINIWLAATNVSVVTTIVHSRDEFHTAMAISAAIASTLMHLSETKHGLPGIFPFNQYSMWFLNIDRCMALLASMFLIYYHWHNVTLWTYGVIGLICMALSEYRHTPLWLFCYLHTAWHLLVYRIFLIASTTKYN